MFFHVIVKATVPPALTVGDDACLLSLIVVSVGVGVPTMTTGGAWRQACTVAVAVFE